MWVSLPGSGEAEVDVDVSAGRVRVRAHLVGAADDPLRDLGVDELVLVAGPPDDARAAALASAGGRS